MLRKGMLLTFVSCIDICFLYIGTATLPVGQQNYYTLSVILRDLYLLMGHC